jgi:hypothetical protein
VQGYAVGFRVALATEKGCGYCDWCTRGLYKSCEDGGPIGFAGLPFGSPLLPATRMPSTTEKSPSLAYFPRPWKIAWRPGDALISRLTHSLQRRSHHE